MYRNLQSLKLAASVALLVVLGAGCSDGQLVDAGGENGQGGAAFVLLVVFFFIFLGALFYMDRVRQRRMGDDSDE